MKKLRNLALCAALSTPLLVTTGDTTMQPEIDVEPSRVPVSVIIKVDRHTSTTVEPELTVTVPENNWIENGYQIISQTSSINSDGITSSVTIKQGTKPYTTKISTADRYGNTAKVIILGTDDLEDTK